MMQIKNCTGGGSYGFIIELSGEINKSKEKGDHLILENLILLRILLIRSENFS